MNSIPSSKYHLVARLLHWILAVGFVFMWLCGFSMANVVADDSIFEEILFFLHISVGVTLFFAVATRVVVRFIFKTPPPISSDHISQIERVGSHVAHAALYALPFLVICVGWAEVDFGGHQVQWFGINVPKIFPTMETLGSLDVEELTETLHRWLAYIMLGIAVVHVAAVFKHRWFDKHDILVRMTISNRKQ